MYLTLEVAELEVAFKVYQVLKAPGSACAPALDNDGLLTRG